MEKLGPIETSRFLSFPPRKRIESVKRHQKWQSELDKNKLLDDLFGSKAFLGFQPKVLLLSNHSESFELKIITAEDFIEKIINTSNK